MSRTNVVLSFFPGNGENDSLKHQSMIWKRKRKRKRSRIIESYLVEFLDLDPKEAVEIFEEDEEELEILEDQDDILLQKLARILDVMMVRKEIKRSAKRSTRYIA